MTDALFSPLGIWLVILGGGALFLDLWVHRKTHVIGLTEASLWSAFYIGIAAIYGGLVYLYAGSEMATLYATGYILEKALSVDNLFVFGVIFGVFSIPSEYQHRILHLGILGAVIFRLIFVALGAAFMHYVEGWAMLTFALILGYVTYKMGSEDDMPITETWYYKAAHRVQPINYDAVPSAFFTGNMATRALPALITIELADVMFAFDSVPAVIAVSREPIIIYSAMIMAILGLRALYFVLEALKKMLHLLEKAVIGILAFICLKLVLHAAYSFFPSVMASMNKAIVDSIGTKWLDLQIEPHESLTVICGMLVIATVLSLMIREEHAVQ